MDFFFLFRKLNFLMYFMSLQMIRITMREKYLPFGTHENVTKMTNILILMVAVTLKLRCHAATIAACITLSSLPFLFFLQSLPLTRVTNSFLHDVFVVYLALFGPTEPSSNDDDAVIALSGISPDSIPRAFWHFPAKNKERGVSHL